MSYYGFKPYVPVAKRREQAAREAKKLSKGGRVLAPIAIEGRLIAASFWGKAWCDNLERYSDFENRLPRGRTYVRNGSVIDLQISRGRVEALVSGSDMYRIKIDIAVSTPERWKAICGDCAGSVGSIVELLQGRLSKNVMERVCREGDGLFPAPKEIKLNCSCPDWADMCKHVAAALYGVGARLDTSPDLLFTLRGVERGDLISNVGAELPLSKAAPSERALADDDMAALFGIEMEAPVKPAPAATAKAAPPKAVAVASLPPASRGRPPKAARVLIATPKPIAAPSLAGKKRTPKATIILPVMARTDALPAPVRAGQSPQEPPAPAKRGRPRKAMSPVI